jgi:hypothetical protein
VEIWFNRITQQSIRRGTFRSVKELVAKIDAFVQNSNASARPFVLDRNGRFDLRHSAKTM